MSISNIAKRLLVPIMWCSILITGCVSCAHYASKAYVASAKVPLTADDVASSTFKINVTVDVDISSLPEEITGGLKVYSSGSSGTAFIIGEHEGRSLIMTAGHICETDLFFDTRVGPLLVLDVRYKLTDRNGDVVDAEILAAVDNDTDDVCILTADRTIGKPLYLASEDPAYAETVSYVGAPGGMWSKGMTPIFTGQYSGRLTSKDSEVVNIIFTAATTPGASGAPVFTSRGVIGVLVALSTIAKDVTYVTPWEVCSEALKEAERFLDANAS